VAHLGSEWTLPSKFNLQASATPGYNAPLYLFSAARANCDPNHSRAAENQEFVKRSVRPFDNHASDRLFLLKAKASDAFLPDAAPAVSVTPVIPGREREFIEELKLIFRKMDANPEAIQAALRAEIAKRAKKS